MTHFLQLYNMIAIEKVRQPTPVSPTCIANVICNLPSQGKAICFGIYTSTMLLQSIWFILSKSILDLSVCMLIYPLDYIPSLRRLSNSTQLVCFQITRGAKAFDKSENFVPFLPPGAPPWVMVALLVTENGTKRS